MYRDVLFNVVKRGFEKRTHYRLHKLTKNDLYYEKPLDISIVKELIFAKEIANFSFLIPTEKLVWGYGIKFNDFHPFVRFFKKENALEKFYSNYAPLCMHNALFLNCNLNSLVKKFDLNYFNSKNNTHCNLNYQNESLWLPYNKINKVEPEYNQSQGPLAKKFIQESKSRLLNLQKSIQKSGYRPELYLDDLTGYFLLNQDFSDYRFFNTGGSHRIATLVSLGLNTLKFQFCTGNPRFISTDSFYSFTSKILFERLFSEELRILQNDYFQNIYD